MPTTAKRGFAWWLTMLVLLFTGALGLFNGVVTRGEAQNALQLSITFGVIAYGALGLAAAYGLARNKSWASFVGVLWSITLVYVASTAPVAYAPGEATIVGAVSSGIVTALIGWGVVRTIRVSLRQLPEEMPR